jgi:tetratricopeptide (TPR) repeat protein
MDRLARILRSRPVVPLAAIAAAGLCWLPALLRSSTPAEPVAATSAVYADFTPQVVQSGLPDAGVPADGPSVAARDDKPAGDQLPDAGVPADAPRGIPGPDLLLPPPAEVSRLPAVAQQPEQAPAESASAPEPLRDRSGEAPAVVPKPAEPQPVCPAPSHVMVPEAAAKPAEPQPACPAPGRLMIAAASPVRSEQMENLAKQADRQILEGYDLANRGAWFAARAEFTAALRLVAQGLDNDDGTTAHSQALSAALTALKEVQDLLPSGARLESDMNIAAIIAGHRTPVLKNTPPDALRPMAAVKSYFTFAQEQLAAGAGHEVAGSMALCALGKLHAVMARQKSVEIQAPEPKAMVFFQASLLVFPQNYLASNELGVFLAHSGNLVDARRALEHSVAVCGCGVNLGNLAAVYQQLGQQPLAAFLRQKAEEARRVEQARLRGASGSVGGLVEWVPPAAMAQSGFGVSDAPRSAEPAAPANRAGAPTPAASRTAMPAAAPERLSADDFSAPPARLPAVGWLPGPPGSIQK